MAQAISTEVTQDIARAIILIMVVGAVLYLAITGHPIPDGLLGISTFVVGYFFGNVQKTYADIKTLRGVSNGTNG